jgi:hypothetical protein
MNADGKVARPDIVVSAARPSDEGAVVALWKVAGLVVAYNDPVADFQFACGGSSSNVLVGKDLSGKLLGTALVGHDGHRGWLYYAATDPEFRRVGIGRRMVEAGIEWLQQRDVPKVQLMVRETNTQVVAFYERLGFEVTPRVVMAKWLR